MRVEDRGRATGLAVFGIASVLYLAATLRVLNLEIDRLLVVVPDDAFYYLQIAGNLSARGLSTFDGAAPTNGYHPLWMAVLTSIVPLSDDPAIRLRIALALSFLLHAAGALVLSAVVARIVDRRWGWTAGACWLINPLAFTFAVTATEAVLVALAAMVALLAHLRLADDYRRRSPAFRQLITYGAALGALCLARTDGVIVAALGVIWVAGRSWAVSGNLPATLRHAMVVTVTAAAVLAPWWLFSYWQTGTLSQDSGAMKMLWTADRYPTAAGRLGNLWTTTVFFTRRCLSLMTVWNYSWGSFAVLVLALAGACWFLLTKRADTLAARVVPAVLAPVAALTLAYGILLVDRQVWWLVLPCLAYFVIVFTAVPALAEALDSRRRLDAWVRFGVVLFAIAVFARWHIKGYEPYPWQPDVRHSQLALSAHVPPHEVVGAFNAGIPAFFGSHRVVALDGLVNHDARRCWESRRLDAYLQSQDVRFIADEERVMARALRFSHPRVELVEVTAFKLRGWPSGRRILWRVSIVDDTTASPAGSHSRPRMGLRTPGTALPCPGPS